MDQYLISGPLVPTEEEEKEEDVRGSGPPSDDEDYEGPFMRNGIVSSVGYHDDPGQEDERDDAGRVGQDAGRSHTQSPDADRGHQIHAETDKFIGTCKI
jgi:hypothetical protein